MKVAGIVFLHPYSGIGKYTQNTVLSLNKYINIDLIYFQENVKFTYYNSYNVKPILDIPYLQKINRELNKVRIFEISKEYDIYHFFESIIPFDLLYKRFSPKIMTAYDLIPFKYTGNFVWDSIYKMYLTSYNISDFIISISENTKKDLVEILHIQPEKIEVVYPSINEKIFKKMDKIKTRTKMNLDLNKKIILHVGAEYKTKNIIGLLEIYSKLKKEYDDLILIRIGKPRKETLEYIKNNDLKDVVYISNLSDQELCMYYNMADVFLFPSLYEGFGLPVLEAMACGCPVIASNSSSIPEILGPTEFTIDPLDTDKFVSKTMKILDDEKLAKKISERNYRRSKLFNSDVMAKKIINIYKKVLNSR